MMSHPFEIKASVSGTRPAILMITPRGAPAQSIAEIYLPAVASADVIALADTIYGRHRLTATDPHTIQFPATDLTLIPVPAGAGAYAGLLSLDARPAPPQGHDFSVSVRQLNPVTAALPRSAKRTGRRDVKIGSDDTDQQRASEGHEPASSFSWRRVQGSFQFTFTSKSEQVLATEQVRLLSWLKWRVDVTPPAHRWKLVLERYLKHTESVVWGLGTDPNSVPPSEIGNVIDHDRDGDGDGDGDDWKYPIPVRDEREATGKVSAIHYDRFGDFRGFTIRTEGGHDLAYLSTEHLVEELVRTAWVERTVVQVISDEHHRERPERITLLRYH